MILFEWRRSWLLRKCEIKTGQDNNKTDFTWKTTQEKATGREEETNPL